MGFVLMLSCGMERINMIKWNHRRRKPGAVDSDDNVQLINLEEGLPATNSLEMQVLQTMTDKLKKAAEEEKKAVAEDGFVMMGNDTK